MPKLSSSVANLRCSWAGALTVFLAMAAALFPMDFGGVQTGGTMNVVCRVRYV